jgi:diguanylate cyclase (GGDEF)-like protein/PAS domain S-box-containing protein
MIDRTDNFEKEVRQLRHQLAALEQLFEVYERATLDQASKLERLLDERTESEKVLREKEEHISLLLNSTGEGIVGINLAGRINFCNPAALHLLGHSSTPDLLGKKMDSLVHHASPARPLYTPERWQTLLQAVRTVESVHVDDETFLRADQTTFPVEYWSYPMIHDGKSIGAVITFIDISERRRAEEDLRRLAAIVESSDDAIVGKTTEGIVVSWNLASERIYGYLAHEIIGKPISILLPADRPDEMTAILEKIKAGKNLKHYETVRVRKDGKQIPIDLTISAINDATGSVVGVSTIARDITERIRAEERLQLWSRVLDQSAEGIFVCDPQERILLVNTAFEKLTGFSGDEAIGKTPRILQSGRQDRTFYADMWKRVLETGTWSGEMWNRRKSGELYIEWLSISAVYDPKGVVTHYVGIFSDITVRKQAEERMVHLAHYDALTDLPNRVLLIDRLNQLIKAAQRRRYKVAVVSIDLDRFKEVNDSLGHDAGDLLLQTLAKRFSNVMRGEDTLARIGGDEFVVVIQGLHQGQDAAIIAKGLRSCLAEPVTLNGYEHTVTASMGISLYPDDATDGQEMIRNADAAMYKAKGAGRNAFQFYTSDLNRRALEMLSMENALRRAVERQEFVLHYQPQVDISSGCVVGAEALIRWNHPELGLVMPGKFISIAEERGLIVPIGSWVIEEAARQAAVWQNAGTSIPIAVNVSAVQFRQKDFVEQLANIVRKHGITANHLELELTERVIMRDAETTVEILARLHDMGFQLSIDDFGTGYSSLSYLRRFPMDKIKIDQSFVTDVIQIASAGSIVTAIIGLARSLKLRVIAEGVETTEQLEILREQSCDEAQGFLFSPALGPEPFEKLVREWKPKYWASREPLTV